MADRLPTRYSSSERIENITDWGLEQFRNQYCTDAIHGVSKKGDAIYRVSTKTKQITKEDIFHYTYAVLHNPAYRKKYELNLKREFPRIPFYFDFWQWAKWGKELMELHFNYETVKPFALKTINVETPRPASARPSLGGWDISENAEDVSSINVSGKKLDNVETARFAVSKTEADASLMRLYKNEKALRATYQNVKTPYMASQKKETGCIPSLQPKIKTKLKADKAAGIIELDDQTKLTGIPKEAWDYKLGNRSALEWILDQYKEKKPSDPTIAEKFNTYRFADYKEHVIDLLKRVCTISVATMKIVKEMEKSAKNE